MSLSYSCSSRRNQTPEYGGKKLCLREGAGTPTVRKKHQHCSSLEGILIFIKLSTYYGLHGVSPMTQQWRIRLRCRRYKRHKFDPWVRIIPWRVTGQPTPVLLPGESHGQKKPGRLQSMGSQSDMTQQLSTSTNTLTYITEPTQQPCVVDTMIPHTLDQTLRLKSMQKEAKCLARFESV